MRDDARIEASTRLDALELKTHGLVVGQCVKQAHACIDVEKLGLVLAQRSEAVPEGGPVIIIGLVILDALRCPFHLVPTLRDARTQLLTGCSESILFGKLMGRHDKRVRRPMMDDF
jgi:hypothetical protein